MEGWNGLRTEYGEFVELVPAQQWLEEDTWYQGTADAVYQSLDIIASHRPEFVVILAGDHIYKMDYGEMLAAHVESTANLTVACTRVPLSEASNFGVMSVDEHNRIVAFDEKPHAPTPLPNDPSRALVSMGIYVFSFDYLASELQRDAADAASKHDFGQDIIPYAIATGRHVQAFPLRDRGHAEGYWRDVGTIDSYYTANMELVGPQPALDLYDPHWPIWTYQPQYPAATFTDAKTASPCTVNATMVSGGCVVHSSQLSRSLLFSNVKVDAGCQLDGVLALPDCIIGANCRLRRVILDNGCEVPPGTVIGQDPEGDAKRYHRTENGIVVANRSMFGQAREYLPATPRRQILDTRANARWHRALSSCAVA